MMEEKKERKSRGKQQRKKQATQGVRSHAVKSRGEGGRIDRRKWE
jgi:hypothetical protein